MDGSSCEFAPEQIVSLRFSAPAEAENWITGLRREYDVAGAEIVPDGRWFVATVAIRWGANGRLAPARN
ncbi:MAG TPA: hypothetical protein VG756_12485 [Pseudonocardiaceae bacterium]|nr:hypothetical protein [Pseudonocardiaceae bacterium]